LHEQGSLPTIPQLSPTLPKFQLIFLNRKSLFGCTIVDTLGRWKLSFMGRWSL